MILRRDFKRHPWGNWLWLIETWTVSSRSKRSFLAVHSFAPNGQINTCPVCSSAANVKAVIFHLCPSQPRSGGLSLPTLFLIEMNFVSTEVSGCNRCNVAQLVAYVLFGPNGFWMLISLVVQNSASLVKQLLQKMYRLKNTQMNA